MKIIIISEGPGLTNQVDPRFGRAKHFVLFDTETGEASSHDNAQNLNAPQGAGIQAAQTVAQLGAEAVLTARLGAEAVLTGHVGPKAFTTLHAANIAVYTGATGTVNEAIEQYKNNKLPLATKANVEGHWV